MECVTTDRRSVGSWKQLPPGKLPERTVPTRTTSDNDVLSKRLSKEMTDRIGLPVSRTPCLARRTQRSRRFVLVTGRCVLSPVAPRSPTPRKTSFNSSSKDLVALLFVREGIEAPQTHMFPPDRLHVPAQRVLGRLQPVRTTTWRGTRSSTREVEDTFHIAQRYMAVEQWTLPRRSGFVEGTAPWHWVSYIVFIYFCGKQKFPTSSL